MITLFSTLKLSLKEMFYINNNSSKSRERHSRWRLFWKECLPQREPPSISHFHYWVLPCPTKAWCQKKRKKWRIFHWKRLKSRRMPLFSFFLTLLSEGPLWGVQPLPLTAGRGTASSSSQPDISYVLSPHQIIKESLNFFIIRGRQRSTLYYIYSRARGRIMELLLLVHASYVSSQLVLASSQMALSCERR